MGREPNYPRHYGEPRSLLIDSSYSFPVRLTAIMVRAR
nr:MAG TPA: hypothetical protein [Caudoviricetes sp.]